jgi:manganese/iron transport system permease protein/iron/zinc/copper transport system permease protein
MLFCTIQFLVVLCLAPRYGILARWLRLRRIVPQQQTEDILGFLIRKDNAALSDIGKSLPLPIGKIKKAIRNLASDGLLTIGDRILLTDAGRKEATKILRAHRLWESYLAHVGIPGPEIHPKAHELEHTYDQNTMEYLDDLLGHPVTDPHGQEIPEEPACKLPGSVISLSVLRKGDIGIIGNLVRTETGLRTGDRIIVDNRSEDGKSWIIFRADGIRFILDHQTADEIMVACE